MADMRLKWGGGTPPLWAEFRSTHPTDSVRPQRLTYGCCGCHTLFPTTFPTTSNRFGMHFETSFYLPAPLSASSLRCRTMTPSYVAGEATRGRIALCFGRTASLGDNNTACLRKRSKHCYALTAMELNGIPKSLPGTDESCFNISPCQPSLQKPPPPTFGLILGSAAEQRGKTMHCEL